MPIINIAPKGEAQVYGKSRLAENYRLYAVPANQRNLLVDLGGHQVVNVSWEEDDGRSIVMPRLVAGAWIPDTHWIRSKRITGMSADLMIPAGSYSPVDEMNGACYTLVAKYNCPDGTCDDEYIVYDQTIIHEVRETDKYVGYGDNGGIIERMASFNARRVIHQPGWGNILAVTAETNAASIGIYSGTTVLRDCGSACSDNGFTPAYRAGGGTSATLKYSDDGFATTSALTISGVASNGNIVTDIYADDSIVLFTFSTEPDPFAWSTDTGGVAYSLDGGTTWARGKVSGSNITASMYGVTRADGRFVAVGKGVIYTSVDGANWSAVTLVGGYISPVFTGVAYDTKTLNTFIVGNDGTNGIVYALKTTQIPSDISSTVVTAIGGVTPFPVKVFVPAPGHIVVTGEYGSVREAYDYADAPDTWNNVALSATQTDYVRAVTGDLLSLFVAIGTTLYQRSPFTKMDWDTVTIPMAITGDFYMMFKDVDETTGRTTRIYAGTTAGELVTVQNCRPNLSNLVSRSATP